MVSLKRYLNGEAEETTLRQTVALLVERFGASAVESDPADLKSFREDLTGIHDALTRDLPSRNVLTLAESVAQRVESYNRRVTETIGRQRGEFCAVVGMIEESLVKIASENAESVQGLGRIREDLEHGNGFRDLDALKHHLRKCLKDLQREIEREKAGSREIIEKLQLQIEGLRRSDGSLLQPGFDPATGAQGQQDCLAALQEAIDRGTRHYVLVTIVNRVQPINARFGRNAGDRMLLRFKEYLENQLTSSDQLFRWTGPAMVALLERQEEFSHVRSLVRRMLDVPIEETYELSGRSVLIPISAAWSMFVLSSTKEATEKQIHAFIASQGCRDFL
jgi:GGDEF domain-containing protein